MLGKLAGAWLGEKMVGGNKGAKGAILGYGAATLARRSVPTLAALALGGWALNRWRNKRRAEPSYPSDASPSS
jgi:alpha-D-ribose 1-methylphosphonate 5-triphosphate synthase subunit PhnG